MVLVVYCKQMEFAMSKTETTLDWTLGDWTFEIHSEGKSEPELTGKENVRRIGSWIVAESTGQDADGGPSHMITTLGFDPDKQAFVGAVVGTMATAQFVLQGVSDETGALLLETEGPAITEGNKTDRYRDIWRSTGKDTREIVAQVLTKDGRWKDFMRYTFKRA